MRDDELHRMVVESMDAFRRSATELLADPATVSVLEALVLGAEVQRALGRPVDTAAFTAVVERLTTAE